MPSEKKNKKEMKESLKPLGYYVKDRVELTKQLFSCLKKNQIKNRLTSNLKNKSIERIQQMCLDEILGISTKRLLSIINNEACPINTDSSSDDDKNSDVEILSLEEISSDSEEGNKKAKINPRLWEKPKKELQDKKFPKILNSYEAKQPNTNVKEMTMLELLELQARARAIRSQLALEPVTKIELSDEENDKKKAIIDHDKIETVNENQQSHATKKKTDDLESLISTSTSEMLIDTNNSSAVNLTTLSKPAAALPKPVKLKRNYKGHLKIPHMSVGIPVSNRENYNESGSDSSDIITIDTNLETYFVSDSDEEDKATLLKGAKRMIKETAVLNEITKSDNDNVIKYAKIITALDVNHEQKQDDSGRMLNSENNAYIKLPSESQELDDDDDDVVDIYDEETELMIGSDKETPKTSETWEERWISSSKTQKVLRMTRIASKAREMALKSKVPKTTDEGKQIKNDKTKTKENEVNNAEEGSIEQFKTLRNIITDRNVSN